MLEHQVHVIIAALFFKREKEGVFRFADYTLVVVDEAHHTFKKHFFNQVMRKLYDLAPMKPKIFAMTASPVSNGSDLQTAREALLALETNLDCCVCMPSSPEAQAEIASSVHKPPPRVIQVPYSPQEQALRKLLLAHLMEFSQSCCGGSGLTLPEDLQPEDALFQVFVRTAAETILEEGCGGASDTAVAEMRHLLQLCDAVDGLNEAGVAFAASVIGAMVGSNVVSTGCGGSWRALRKGAASMVGTLDSKGGSPLVRELVAQLADFRKADPLRVIVFVSLRETAWKLAATIRQSPELDFLRPVTMVGHGGADGMSVSQQNDVVAKFRDGRANIVVSTSVLEEGFDVPVCNAVVRLDVPATVTALIQSRGRARYASSSFLVLCHPLSGDVAHMQALLDAERVSFEAVCALQMEREHQEQRSVAGNAPQSLPAQARSKPAVPGPSTSHPAGARSQEVGALPSPTALQAAQFSSPRIQELYNVATTFFMGLDSGFVPFQHVKVVNALRFQCFKPRGIQKQAILDTELEELARLLLADTLSPVFRRLVTERSTGKAVEQAPMNKSALSEARKAELIADAVAKIRAAQTPPPVTAAKFLNHFRTKILKPKACEREGIGSADLEAIAESVRQQITFAPEP
jgi:hypothetical protein